MDAAPTRNLLDNAMALHRAGQLTAAARAYEAVLAQDAANFDALHFRGMIALHEGNARHAIDLLRRAVAVVPQAHPAVHQLGLAYVADGQPDAAARQFGDAIRLAPDFLPAHEALASLKFQQGRMEEAAASFATMVQLAPANPAAHCNLGATLNQLGRQREALACFERALAIDPNFAAALLNSATVLVALSRLEEAVAPYRQLLALAPQDAQVLYKAGFVFYSQGLRDEAQSAFAQALLRDPLHVESRWAQVMAELPLAYGPDEDPAHFRERFSSALASLDAWFDAAHTPLGYRAVGSQQPFYLAFHDVDNVSLLSRYGDLCARLMQAKYSVAPPRPRAPGSNRPVRLAIATRYFYDHAVWTAQVRGWCAQMDRRRIELHLLHIGTTVDAYTAVAESYATSMIGGLTSIEQWIDSIADISPDVLLYPEIGMDDMCAKLASLRLAPVQVASGGHPETTGLPTIDHYLTAALFEPPDGAAHYREQLVVLPNLGCYYEPLEPQSIAPDLVSLGIADDAPRLVCAGSTYKYFPEHDAIFVDIARRLGRCRFLFFEDIAPRLSRQLEARLAQAFARAGLDAARHVRFIPRQPRPAFFGLLRQCDVYLDTIGFSGFNSAIQAVECGLPVVTWEGTFMRGRLGAGVMRRMGIDDLVVHGASAYADAAVRLCSDSGYRRDVRQRIAMQSHRLYRDPAPVRALEDFLVHASDGRLARP